MFHRRLLVLITALWATTAQSQSVVSAQSINAWAKAQAASELSALERPRIEVQVSALEARTMEAPCAAPNYAVAPGQRLWGRSAVVVTCPGISAWSLRVPLMVRVWANALVAVRTLPALMPIRAQDLRTAEVELSREAHGVLTDMAQLAGRVSTRMISAGQPVPLAALRAPQVVSQGDPVKVLGQGQGFSIAVEATAMGAALEGQNVRVRTESGRVLTGVARNGRVVEVTF